MITEIECLIQSYNDDTWQYAEGNAYYAERDANQVKKQNIYQRIKELTNDLSKDSKIAMYYAVGASKSLLNAFNLVENDLLTSDEIKYKELMKILFSTSVALRKDGIWYNLPLYLTKGVLKPTASGNRGMTGLFRSFLNKWSESLSDASENLYIEESINYGLKELGDVDVWDYKNDKKFDYYNILQDLLKTAKLISEEKRYL